MRQFSGGGVGVVHRARLVEVVEGRRVRLGAAVRRVPLVEVEVEVEVHHAPLGVATRCARLVEVVEVHHAALGVATCCACLVEVHRAPLRAAHCDLLVVVEHHALAAQGKEVKIDKKINSRLSKWDRSLSSCHAVRDCEGSDA